jgi:peptidoglycan hydrolase CwlO-like protein
LSTLTKVLIVLLTVFSIFLSGIVVTYVANSENQRKRADGFESQLRAAKETQRNAVQELEQEKQRAQNEKAQLDGQLNQLGVQLKTLLAELDSAKRDNAQLVQKVASMAATVEMANATAKQQTALFETAQNDVRGLQTEQTNRKKELDETNQTLMEKMSIIAQLEEKVRRLTEESQAFQTRLNQGLQPYGRVAARPPTTIPATTRTVMPVPPAPSPAAAQTKPIGLNGRVTAVDMKNRLAQISIGTAGGVRQDMKFYVTRGDRFVANILILDVSPDKAVGILDLVQAEPQIGDTVTTNL